MEKLNKTIIIILIVIVIVSVLTVVSKGNKSNKKSIESCIKECEIERGRATWNGTPAYGGVYQRYEGKYDCNETCNIINK